MAIMMHGGVDLLPDPQGFEALADRHNAGLGQDFQRKPLVGGWREDRLDLIRRKGVFEGNPSQKICLRRWRRRDFAAGLLVATAGGGGGGGGGE